MDWIGGKGPGPKTKDSDAVISVCFLDTRI